MSPIEFKRKVLESARARQQELIDDFRSRIEEMRKSEMTVNADEFDDEDRSFNAATSNLVNNLAEELNFLLEEMEILNRMQVEDLHQSAAVGSVVKTDKRTFYPSVSIESFQVNGDEVFGISSKAPLFQVMKGKKVGDTFSFKGEDYRILELL
jgi:hypothetical protein